MRWCTDASICVLHPNSGCLIQSFCFDLPGCFQGLHIWSGIMGSKSGKLRYVLWIMTISQTLVILLVEPMFLPEIHTKDDSQQWKMEEKHPKHKGKCPERISPDWIYTNCLQDDPSGAISVIADVFHKE